MIPRCLLNQAMSLAAETTLKNLRYLQDKRAFKNFSNSLKTELAKELFEKIPIYLHLFQHSGSSKANSSYINRQSWREVWEGCPEKFLFDEVAASKTSAMKNWVWIPILEILPLPPVRIMILMAWKMHGDLGYLLLFSVLVEVFFLPKFEVVSATLEKISTSLNEIQ